MLKLPYIPYDWVRSVFRWFRRTAFTIDRPDGKYVLIKASRDRVRKILGEESYGPNWEFSYHEKGENENLAQVDYWDDHEYYTERRGLLDALLRRDGEEEKIVWWQVHTRGWTNEDGHQEHKPHWEPEPTEYDRAHIQGVGMSEEKGREGIIEVLEENDIEYEIVERNF